MFRSGPAAVDSLHAHVAGDERSAQLGAGVGIVAAAARADSPGCPPMIAVNVCLGPWTPIHNGARTPGENAESSVCARSVSSASCSAASTGDAT